MHAHMPDATTTLSASSCLSRKKTASLRPTGNCRQSERDNAAKLHLSKGGGRHASRPERVAHPIPGKPQEAPQEHGHCKRMAARMGVGACGCESAAGQSRQASRRLASRTRRSTSARAASIAFMRVAQHRHWATHVCQRPDATASSCASMQPASPSSSSRQHLVCLKVSPDWGWGVGPRARYYTEAALSARSCRSRSTPRDARGRRTLRQGSRPYQTASSQLKHQGEGVALNAHADDRQHIWMGALALAQNVAGVESACGRAAGKRQRLRSAPLGGAASC